jgi:PAS domain S-box-containing protein
VAVFSFQYWLGRIKSRHIFSRYKEVFDLAGHAIVLINNRTNKFVKVNQAALDLFGYNKAEFMKMTPTRLFIQAETTDFGFLNKAGSNIVIPAKRKDGTIITVNIFSSLSVRFCICIINDVTEEYRIRRALEMNEERLRDAQRIGKFGWWEFRPETGIYFGSDELARIFMDSAETTTITYKENISFAHPEDRSYLRSTIEAAMEQKAESFVLHYRIITPAGKIKTVEINSHAKYDENGHLLLRYGTCQDVTENQAIMDELITARHKAEESDKLKSAFLANFSHEIRTPLNAMMGFINIMTSISTSEKERAEMVHLIEANSKRLLRIINDTIDLSRIESNNMEIKFANVDINNFLSNIQPTLFFDQLIFETKEINIKCVNEGSNRRIFQYLDESRLGQIFGNLLNNAIKFTDKGEIRYGYRLSESNSADIITYYVSDTGSGISPQLIDEIFKPFYQIWNENLPKSQGAGLGLAICKRLVEMMKGRIWIDSVPGKGTTVFFSFSTPVRTA